MGNYTIAQMFENPGRGRQARNFTTNVPKILSLKSFPEQIFSENCRWVPLNKALDLYDVDDIRTWRTICPRCNIARTLLCPPTCCFQQFELLFCFLWIFLFVYQQLQLFFFFFNDCIVLFCFVFLINEGCIVIGQAVVVSLPNNFYVFMYKDCILVRRS